MNDFNTIISRQNTDSGKWLRYPPDVLPMWVADMDFASPPAVIEALQTRAAHGIYGYGGDSDELQQLICARMQRLYNWRVQVDEIVPLPSVISAFNVACRAVGEPGDGVLIQTPVYPPFLSAPKNQQRQLHIAELSAQIRGDTLEYVIDFDEFAANISDNTRLFLLCHPHNPIGRSFSPSELTRMAELCLQRGVTICSDEIHADLILDGEHRPLASLSPDIAQQTISLFAASKTYNIAGLGYSYAIIQNANLRRAYRRAMAGIVADVNIFSVVAALAAYRDGDEWLADMLAYLRANRDFATAYLRDQLPQLKLTHPLATFLLWLDGRAVAENPYEFFLQHGKVAFNDGKLFGPGGAGFVRLNFACPRQILEDGLQRMRRAVRTGI